MENVMDPLNIILLAGAAFLFWRLRGVLGERTGTEKPPFDPAVVLKKPEPATDPKIDIPPQSQTDEEDSKPVWHGVTEAGTDLANGLEAIATASKGLNLKEFTNGASMAYEMILEAFAAGDKPALKSLLAKDVFEGFSSAIDERKKLGQTLAIQFVGVKYAKPEAARLDGKKAQITVHFVGEMISAKTDKQGAVIEGDTKSVRDVHDHWTFERDTSSKDPNWKLISTDDEPGQ